MNHIRILDCTLRDGGYCNSWKFGKKNIIRIMENLSEAGIDIIECGFLTDHAPHDNNITKHDKIEEFSQYFVRQGSQKFVCMINYGEYEAANLPEYHEGLVDGIRVAFHKDNMAEALEVCKEISSKGYLVFVQPMLSLNYTDEEFLELISRCNEFKPYAFYIVDSFGVMKRKDLIRLFHLVDRNLKQDIDIGYHCHNNLQLAFSNAQTFVDGNVGRNLIIDSSIYGMGRGAGNLNTELFVGYLNENHNKDYIRKPLLMAIDKVISRFYAENPWGYSLPNFLSAVNNCHPSYAGFLEEKKMLTIDNMDEIFKMISSAKSNNYDPQYIQDLYSQYMSRNSHGDNIEKIKNSIKDKKVLIIAPGKSAETEKEKIVEFASRNEVISFSINFIYDYANCDFIFISNIRRYQDMDKNCLNKGKIIITSNIEEDTPVFANLPYRELLNNSDTVGDNSMLMLIKLLIKCGIGEIFIAGLDGYSYNGNQNFINNEMSFSASPQYFETMNKKIEIALSDFSKNIQINYLTMPMFLDIGNSSVVT